MSNHKIVPGKTRFYAVYADGRPQWEVTRSRGDGVWEAKVVKSLDWEGTVKVFTTEEISKALAWEAFFKKNSKDHGSFYESLPLGTIVHYDNGFENWVRCEVVLGTTVHNAKPHKCLKPIALAGNWRSYDLPQRDLTGTIRLGYHADHIAKGECFEPNFGSIYEANSLNWKTNPCTLKALDLSVPPLSPAEEATAKLWQAVTKAREALDSQESDPTKRLLAAQAAIESVLGRDGGGLAAG